MKYCFHCKRNLDDSKFAKNQPEEFYTKAKYDELILKYGIKTTNKGGVNA